MTILARVLALLGLILIVVAAVLLVNAGYNINLLHAVASSNRSLNYENPIFRVVWTAGIALLGGLLAGLGLGLMMRHRTTTLPK